MFRIILIFILFQGFVMAELENFDDLFVGYPQDIEHKLNALLPQAQALDDNSIYVQILSQIALAQAMQKHFDEAHETLNRAEKMVKPHDHLARTRLILERGRVYMQMGNYEAAKPLFKQSYELAEAHHLDEHTINAAHMVAIFEAAAEDKIKWNERAIQLAEISQLPRARAWLGSLYHNLAQSYIDGKRYEKALDAYKKAQKFREEEGYEPNIRVAKWGVARSLRLLNRYDESLAILFPLLEEYAQGKGDMPEEMFTYARGLVYEELAENYMAKGKAFSRIAYDDLSKNEWFVKLEPDRLERLKQLKEPIR